MLSYQIGEKELKVIEEVSKNNHLTQRQISHKAGISVGMANLILKRLVRKGYIKIKGLNRRNLQYTLTPKGFTQKTERSYRLLLRTINSWKKIKGKVQELVLEEYCRGQRKFVILGKGELADLVEISLRDLDTKDLKFRRILEKEVINNHHKATILVAEEGLQLEGSRPGGGKLPRWLNVVDHITDIFASSPYEDSTRTKYPA